MSRCADRSMSTEDSPAEPTTADQALATYPKPVGGGLREPPVPGPAALLHDHHGPRATRARSPSPTTGTVDDRYPTAPAVPWSGRRAALPVRQRRGLPQSVGSAALAVPTSRSERRLGVLRFIAGWCLAGEFVAGGVCRRTSPRRAVQLSRVRRSLTTLRPRSRRASRARRGRRGRGDRSSRYARSGWR